MENGDDAPRPLVAIVYDKGSEVHLQEAIDNLDPLTMDHVTIESSGDRQTDALAVVRSRATHAVVMYSGGKVSQLFPSTASYIAGEGIVTVAVGQCDDSMLSKRRFRHIRFWLLDKLAVYLRESPADRLRSFASAGQIEVLSLQEQAQNLGIVASRSIGLAIAFEQKHAQRLAARQEAS